MVEFEIRERDLLARIGKLKTKSGRVETPLFLPVINPARERVTPAEMWAEFGCRMLITNAYIVKKHFGDSAKEMGVHRLLGFPGVVMTDSGAYQILAYGKVDVTPVQGGRYLDLVAFSAREMARLPFDVHALGSPTPLMEQYLFEILVDMIMTAKMSLPPERPFHLFGEQQLLLMSFILNPLLRGYFLYCFLGILVKPIFTRFYRFYIFLFYQIHYAGVWVWAMKMFSVKGQ